MGSASYTFDDQPSDQDSDDAYYFDISAGSYDTGFLYRDDMLSQDERKYAHPGSWNPRGWPLAPGFSPTWPSHQDPAPVLRGILDTLNRQIAVAKAGSKLNSDAVANIGAIHKLIDSIHAW